MTEIRVLLADDDEVSRSKLGRALTIRGFHVTPVVDGAEALERLAAESFDVVIADVDMPRADGLEVLRETKAQHLEISVILLTDPATRGSGAMGLREGAWDYLLKPLDDAQRLAHLIERAVECTRLRREIGRWSADSAAFLPPSPEVGIGALVRLLDQLTTTPALEPALTACAEELAQALGAERAVIFLALADGQFHLTAFRGASDKAAAAKDYVQTLGDEFVWRVAAQRDLLWSPLATSTDVPTERLDGAQMGLGIPFMLGELVLGVAVLYPFSAHETFDESVMEQVKLLARQSTLVVELARLRQEVEETRDRDDVTGVLTRRRFFELAELEYRRSWRFRQPLSALVLDIDDFRHLAQMLGPEAEERVLREVGCLSRGTLRHIDLVGRLQTDTFGILLVMTGREGVGEVAERLRRAVASIEVETPSGPWQVTASLGAAVYPREQVASVHDLFALAEQAVMTSKRAGRNRVTLV